MALTLHSGPAADPGGKLKSLFSAKEGALIFDRTGKKFSLQTKIGSGGEGEVFKLHDRRVCKFFHSDRANNAVFKKLQLMLSHGAPTGAAVCWPESLAVSSDSPPKWLGGYIMAAADGIPLQQLLLPPVLKSKFAHWRRRHLVQLSRTILTTIESLHRHGVLLGDINLLNILVQDENKVAFVDCDSFQIEGFACPVGKLPFIRPARVIDGFDFSKTLRTMDDELFAVAVLLFMILLPGKPPFSHTGGGDVVSNSRKARFPYPWGGRIAEGLPVGPWQYLWSHLTENLKNALGGALEEQGPLPAPIDWVHLLDNYLWAIDKGYSSDELFPTTVKERDADDIVAAGGQKLCCRMKGCGHEFGVRAGKTLQYQICPQCRSRQHARKCPLCGAGFFVAATQYFRAEENKWNLFCPSCWANRPTVPTRDGRLFQPSPQQEFDYKIRTGQIRITT